MNHSASARRLALVWFILAVCCAALAQQVTPKMYDQLRWRAIGPFRGGRTRAVAGVARQPHVFYIGVCNGGVWKTTDAGRTWQPIFDEQPTGSIGAIAVAPSNPNIVFVGSGEGLQRPDLSVGDGIYKSTDAGRTWTHLGLRDGQQIPQIAVDPHNPDRVFAAVLGHPYGANADRGIYRSLDGGHSFQKVLGKDENTGGDDVAFNPANPAIVYATLWEARQGPWENAAWSGSGGGIYKSTDGGDTWRQLTKGLPEGLVQAHIDIAPSDPSRLYASVATARGLGIYRSDDAGESWTQITRDPRPAARIGGGDLPVPKVDPRNPDIVYSASVVTWKSTDGGKTWTGIRGAPGGDDYQNIWINPTNPDILLIASDQGAIITLNGGQTWSSWYNQPTAQLYHVGVDNAFPYRVCSGQQESGSVCVASRGPDGEINFREWHPVGAEEYGFVTPDPSDPDVVYGGKISRYDRRTGQAQNISPKPLRGADFRMVRTEPVIFSPADSHILFFASNTLWKTRDGGQSWQQISPDLTRKTWTAPASIGKYSGETSAQPAQRGVIYAVAPSPLSVNLIWAGTDDGLIQVTRDGGATWKDVTPRQLTAWQKVSIIDAGHFDAQTAYAAINTLRLDDMRPHIYRTHDGGATWTEIMAGIPGGEAVDAVREDTRRKGLLFASTERQVYVSFDDGDHWQSLRLNMPATSVRDIVIKDADLVVATHGRGFWILDDISPLRQMDAATTGSAARLFQPETAMRVRWNTNTDTPLPPDEPAGKNPPDGAVIDYWLGSPPSGPVTLDILDSAGKPVRHYSSADAAEQPDAQLAIPRYWVRPPQTLSAEPGAHRFLWDLHYQPAPSGRPNYPMQAIFQDTAPAPTSPWALPGQYTVKLTVSGHSTTQPLTVKMDPRVKTPAAALAQQFTLSKQLYDQVATMNAALAQVRTIRGKLAAAPDAALEQKLDAVAGREAAGFGGGGGGGRGAGAGATDTLASVRGTLALLMSELQGADVAPTTQLVSAVNDRLKAATAVMARWSELEKELPAAVRP